MAPFVTAGASPTESIPTGRFTAQGPGGRSPLDQAGGPFRVRRGQDDCSVGGGEHSPGGAEPFSTRGSAHQPARLYENPVIGRGRLLDQAEEFGGGDNLGGAGRPAYDVEVPDGSGTVLSRS